MLSLKNIGLNRGKRQLLRDISFSLKPGSCRQLIGPNGSGKSSLLKLIAGVLAKNCGQIERNYSPTDIGFVGHNLGLYSLLTVQENIEFFCNAERQRDLAYTVLGSFGLDNYLQVPVAKLSRGQQQKVAIARLWARKSKLWLLDEPITALDSASKQIFLLLVQRFLQSDGAVIIASHEKISDLPGEVLSLCSR